MTRLTLFNLLKYTIYALLLFDAYQYFQADLASARQTLAEGATYQKLIETFAISVDMTAWLVLVFCFELETAWIAPERMRGALLWGLHGVRAICYLFIFSSFYGYIAKYRMLGEVEPFTLTDLCALVEAGYSYLTGLDEYVPITAESCKQLDLPSFRLIGTNILAAASPLQDARLMALVDVINSGTWLLVVAMLELDVYLREHAGLKGWILRASEAVNVVLYLILLAVAIFYGVKGEFLDFWDSFLWLAAFVLIDLNVLGIVNGNHPPNSAPA
ncbi:MAG: hypothetical protein N3A55_04120 [Methylohalobius sp.]|nr:hypothetical protein [Methylohalobius sp.]